MGKEVEDLQKEAKEGHGGRADWWMYTKKQKCVYDVSATRLWAGQERYMGRMRGCSVERREHNDSNLDHKDESVSGMRTWQRHGQDIFCVQSTMFSNMDMQCIWDAYSGREKPAPVC